MIRLSAIVFPVAGLMLAGLALNQLGAQFRAIEEAGPMALPSLALLLRLAERALAILLQKLPGLP